MSQKTWLAAHYPVPADELAEATAEEPRRSRRLALLDHSIAKWDGLQPAALAAHGIGAHVELPIDVDSTTCSLCRAYYGCNDCPLPEVRDGYACDDKAFEDEISPWQAWTLHHNPAPMLALLRAARARAESEE